MTRILIMIFFCGFGGALIAKDFQFALGINADGDPDRYATGLFLGGRYEDESRFYTQLSIDYGNITEARFFEPRVQAGFDFGAFSLGSVYHEIHDKTGRFDTQRFIGPAFSTQNNRAALTASYLVTTDTPSDINYIADIDLSYTLNENYAVYGSYTGTTRRAKKMIDSIEAEMGMDVTMHNKMLGLERHFDNGVVARLSVGKISLDIFDTIPDRIQFELSYDFNSGDHRFLPSRPVLRQITDLAP